MFAAVPVEKRGEITFRLFAAAEPRPGLAECREDDQVAACRA